MPIGADKGGPSATRYGVLALLVFSLFFAYVRFRLDPRLIYHQQQPVFQLGWAFFAGHLNRPGGVVEYTAALLCSLCSFATAGAIILTLLAASICLLTAGCMACAGGPRWHWASLVPAVLLLVLHNRYHHPLTTDLGLLLTVAAWLAYLRAAPTGAMVGLCVFVVLSVGLYVVAAGPLLLFVLLCAIYESLTGRRAGLAAAYVLCGLVLPYLAGLLLWRVAPVDAYLHLLPFHRSIRPSAASAFLYVLFPVLGIVAALRGRNTKDLRSVAAASAQGGQLRGGGRWLAQAAALLGAGAGLVALTFDRQAQALLRIDYQAARGAWGSVLSEAARLSPGRYSLTTHWDVNRALFHTGRLPYDMFRYPQGPLSLLASNIEKEIMSLSEVVRAHLGGVFLDLGRIAEAEHVTQESLENVGETPPLIQRLALIYLVKQEPDAARVFLRALSKHLLYRDWVESYLERMRQDRLLSDDEQVRRLRSLMILVDHLGHMTIEDMLRQSLERNPHNRMAFEYLMAYYLVNRKLADVVREIGRLDDFDYEGIPPLYEEAILLYVRASRDLAVDLHGREIRQETGERCKTFFNALKSFGGDQRAAREALAGAYGGTYLYYHTFGATARAASLAQTETLR